MAASVTLFFMPISFGVRSSYISNSFLFLLVELFIRFLCAFTSILSIVVPMYFFNPIMFAKSDLGWCILWQVIRFSNFSIHLFISVNVQFITLKLYITTPIVRVLIVKTFFLHPVVLNLALILRPVGSGCWIHRLYLCRGARHPNVCPGYDTKQSDGEVPVMLKHWGMRSTPSLLSFPDPLWPRVVAPDRVLYMAQIELNDVVILNWIVRNWTILTFKPCVSKTIFMLKWIVLIRTVWLNWIAWNRNVFDN